MESLYSAAGIAEYGARVSHEVLCDSIETYCTEPATELLEYIKRDVLNVVMGNKDNHGRNTAFIRHQNGTVALAPLFDFAPMYLDPEGIARVCRWSDDRETAGDPEWARVLEYFGERGDTLGDALRAFGQRLEPLAELMRDCGVDDDIVEQRSHSIQKHVPQLLAL